MAKILEFFNAYVQPTTDDAYDLGAASQEFKNLYIDGTAYIDSIGESILFADNISFTFGTGTGIKLGVTTNTKIGFYNATPVVQATLTADIKDSLVALGFIADSGATPLNLDGGALTVGTVSATGAIIGVSGSISGTVTFGTVSATGNGIFGGLTSVAGAIIGGTSITAGTASFSGNLITGGTASVAGAIIGGTTITVGTVSATGNIIGNTTASGYYLKEGTNASQGVATLALGTINVATTKVASDSRIMLAAQNSGANIGSVFVSGRTAGTSFGIGSSNVLDDRIIAWLIFSPA